MIPRVFHRIWLGPPMPEAYERHWGHFAELHPGWEFRTWVDADLDWLANRDLFDQQPEMTAKADVARYEVLLKHGGVYVDCDTEPLRPFDDLLAHRAFAGYEDQRSIANGVIGAEPDHSAVRLLVEELPGFVAKHHRDAPQQRTGPSFLTAMWKERDDVTLLPPVVFYPVHWRDKAKLGGPYPDKSYAVSHWGGS